MEVQICQKTCCFQTETQGRCDQALTLREIQCAIHVLFIDQSSGYVDDGFIIIHQITFVLCTSPVNILCNKHAFKWNMGSSVVFF